MRSGEVDVVYIGGLGRSGSTLLDRALGSLPGFFAVGEMMHLFGRVMRDDERCSCGRPARSCEIWGDVIADLEADGLPAPVEEVDRLRHRWTEGWALLSPFLPWRSRRARRRLASFQELLARSYHAVRERTGARVLVDSSKNPSFGRILLGTPGVRLHIVHLVRDARGVAHSLARPKRRPGTDRPTFLARRGPVVGALLWSAANVLTELNIGRRRRGVRVRYEDFVRAPGPVLRRVVETVDASAASAPPAHVDGTCVRLGVDHVLSGNRVRSRTGEIELTEDVAWRTRMSAPRRRLVSTLTLPLLRRYGFPARPAGAPREHRPRLARLGRRDISRAGG